MIFEPLVLSKAILIATLDSRYLFQNTTGVDRIKSHNIYVNQAYYKNMRIKQNETDSGSGIGKEDITMFNAGT